MEQREQLERLERLVEAFFELGSSIELEQVLRNTLAAATRLMWAEAGSIALVDESGTHLAFVETTDPDRERLLELEVPLGQGICGHVAQSGEAVRVDEASHDARFYPQVDRRVGRETHGYLCVPLVVEGRVIGTAQLVNRRDGGSFSADDQSLLEGFARQAALAIQNARYHEMRVRQQALESELAVCAEVQRQHFPARAPILQGFELWGCCAPCAEVGGDYFSFVPGSQGGLDLVVADVSGKGLPAAMMVADLHTGVHLLAGLGRSLGETVEELNRHLRATLLVSKFITLVALRVRPGEARVEYVLAGHPSPLLVARSGRVRALEVTGPVLGVVDGRRYPAASVELEPGEVVVAYSDGYSEAESPAGEMLGEETIAAVVGQCVDRPLPEIARRLDEAAAAHRRGLAPHDDMTLLLLRRC